MNRNRQTRCGNGSFHTRAEDGKQFIEGYFAVFGPQYEIFPGAYETVSPVAFDGALDDDIRCLIDHDTRLVLGRNKAGTLSLRTDEKGLWGSVEINPDDQDAMNLYARVRRGDVSQCSFGFDILDEEIEYLENGSVHWTIRRVKLYEVSVVTFPAYEETGVSARRRDFEEIVKRRREAWRVSMKNKLKGEKEDGTKGVDASQEH